MKFKSNARYNAPVGSGTVFETKENEMRVSIHRIHGLNGWYLTCGTLNISQIALKSISFFGAVEESKLILRVKAIDINNAVLKYCEDEPVEIGY